MLIALIFVCSTAVTPDLKNCDRNNAVHVLQVPAEFTNPATCFMHGQAYLAGNAIGQDIAAEERVKIQCVRPMQAENTG